MSDCNMKKLNCPHCGNPMEVLLWDSINAQISPIAREDLLHGKIHTTECPKCNKTFSVDKAILYHDAVNKFMVWYFPFTNLEHSSFYGPFSIDGVLNVNIGIEEDEVPEYPKTLHYVFTATEMIRYIKFREKLAEIKKVITLPMVRSEILIRGLHV